MKSLVRLALIVAAFALLMGSGFGTDRGDSDLNEQISEVLKECEKIKPGATRADVLKVFKEEGGLSSPAHRTYVYRKCGLIKVDVDFTLSNSKKEESPSDVVKEISRPYLQWFIAD